MMTKVKTEELKHDVYAKYSRFKKNRYKVIAPKFIV